MPRLSLALYGLLLVACALPASAWDTRESATLETKRLQTALSSKVSGTPATQKSCLAGVRSLTSTPVALSAV